VLCARAAFVIGASTYIFIGALMALYFGEATCVAIVLLFVALLACSVNGA
jgi:hypothetical protein